MRVLVIGSTGCIGSAVTQALRARGHTVVPAARSLLASSTTLCVDYMTPCTPTRWAERLRDARIEMIVNCVGILIESRSGRFERVHAEGPIELFRGALMAGVKRIVQVSALGVDSACVDVPYLASKMRADDALGSLGIDHAVMRPSLVYGPGSDSASLFATLASLPVVLLPGGGRQRVQPIHVYEVAESIARLIESREALAGVYELAGPQAITYREMLAAYRRALGAADPLWLPVPMALMKLGALAAEAMPQRVYSRDTMRLLERGNTTQHNAAPTLLARAPSALAEGLRVSPPEPTIDLRVTMSPAMSWLVRGAVASLWLYTALITALLPNASGVMTLLERCGFRGEAGFWVMVASCTLNTGLGLSLLRRNPGAWAYAVQVGAVLGYTLTAALNMPELAIDHCGPLAKNLPLLALITVLWCAATPARAVAKTGMRAASRIDTAKGATAAPSQARYAAP
jgi:uncharacterized protein YbjT (DUF2867 family)